MTTLLLILTHPSLRKDYIQIIDMYMKKPRLLFLIILTVGGNLYEALGRARYKSIIGSKNRMTALFVHLTCPYSEGG